MPWKPTCCPFSVKKETILFPGAWKPKGHKPVVLFQWKMKPSSCPISRNMETNLLSYFRGQGNQPVVLFPWAWTPNFFPISVDKDPNLLSYFCGQGHQPVVLFPWTRTQTCCPISVDKDTNLFSNVRVREEDTNLLSYVRVREEDNGVLARAGALGHHDGDVWRVHTTRTNSIYLCQILFFISGTNRTNRIVQGCQHTYCLQVVWVERIGLGHFTLEIKPLEILQPIAFNLKTVDLNFLEFLKGQGHKI